MLIFFKAEDDVNSTTTYIPAVIMTEERMSVPRPPIQTLYIYIIQGNPEKTGIRVFSPYNFLKRKYAPLCIF